jgi:hypothetical protein
MRAEPQAELALARVLTFGPVAAHWPADASQLSLHAMLRAEQR